MDYCWLVLVWRLPSGVSTPRVTTWRRLTRLGAVALTPGAAVVPYSEQVHEQLDWIADDINEWGGDAWVLPVGQLPAADVARIEEQLRLRGRAARPASAGAGRRRAPSVTA